MNWSLEIEAFMKVLGFRRGDASVCNYRHSRRKIDITVHGDDFIIVAPEAGLKWEISEMAKKFEVKTDMLGPEKHMKQEVKFLNRKIRWGEKGIEYESDEKHVPMILEELGLVDAKAVNTPATTSEMKEVASLIDADGEINDGDYMSPEDATAYRAIGARMNFLAQDRTDIQQACRCICMHMAKPVKGCCQLLKRAGRYLKGRPRCFQNFAFERGAGTITGFADSDWAGCSITRKSTSGGVIT